MYNNNKLRQGDGQEEAKTKNKKLKKKPKRKNRDKPKKNCKKKKRNGAKQTATHRKNQTIFKTFKNSAQIAIFTL